jgi:hypothetical protein
MLYFGSYAPTQHRMARTRIRMGDASDEHRLDVVGDGSGGDVPSEDDVEGDEDGEGDEEAAEKNDELGSTTYDVGGTGDFYQAVHEGIEIHLPAVRVAEWIKYKGTGTTNFVYLFSCTFLTSLCTFLFKCTCHSCALEIYENNYVYRNGLNIVNNVLWEK